MTALVLQNHDQIAGRYLENTFSSTELKPFITWVPTATFEQNPFAAGTFQLSHVQDARPLVEISKENLMTHDRFMVSSFLKEDKIDQLLSFVKKRGCLFGDLQEGIHGREERICQLSAYIPKYLRKSSGDYASFLNIATIRFQGGKEKVITVEVPSYDKLQSSTREWDEKTHLALRTFLVFYVNILESDNPPNNKYSTEITDNRFTLSHYRSRPEVLRLLFKEYQDEKQRLLKKE